MSGILFSGFRFSHHNEGSGYHHLVEDQAHFVCGDRLPLGSFPETSVLRRMNYFLLDLVTLLRGLKYRVVHYLYPEHSAYLSPLILKALGKRVVFTVHLSDAYWFAPARTPFGIMKRQSLKHGADAVITLSSDQAAAFSRRLPGREVRFVPHGLEMESPLPGEETFTKRLANPSLVVVGTNYRDFDTLERIIRSKPSGVSFQLIGLDAQSRLRFAGLAGVVCHQRLESERYEEILRTSTAMLLPLTFATANNALLEAHKLYLPCICSDIPGVRDYASRETLFFREPEEFWSAFQQLAGRDVSSYRELCISSHREASRRFAWSSISKELASVWSLTT